MRNGSRSALGGPGRHQGSPGCASRRLVSADRPSHAGTRLHVLLVIRRKHPWRIRGRHRGPGGHGRHDPGQPAHRLVVRRVPGLRGTPSSCVPRTSAATALWMVPSCPTSRATGDSALQREPDEHLDPSKNTATSSPAPSRAEGRFVHEANRHQALQSGVWRVSNHDRGGPTQGCRLPRERPGSHRPPGPALRRRQPDRRQRIPYPRDLPIRRSPFPPAKTLPKDRNRR